MLRKKAKQKTTGEDCGFEKAHCCATDLSPSLPTKLADGLGLKDTPLAWRDTPRAFGSSVLSLWQREIRQTIVQFSDFNIPQERFPVKNQSVV